MFGAVVGLRKPGLHLHAGTDKMQFALLLLELCEALAPALTIVDAVIGMEGEGPGNGDPVSIGAVLAGASPQAVDTVATALVGMRPEQVFTQLQALNSGRPFTRLADLELSGPPLADMCIPHFRAARMTDVNFGLPGWLGRHLKQTLTAYPRPDPHRCQLCHACVRHCPPQAMRIVGQRLLIDYDRCIRCFCCQELCPHGALQTRQGLLLRLNSLLRGRR
jgi:ferredoxin